MAQTLNEEKILRQHQAEKNRQEKENRKKNSYSPSDNPNILGDKKENIENNAIYSKLMKVKEKLNKITCRNPKYWTDEEIEFVKKSKEVFGSI